MNNYNVYPNLDEQSVEQCLYIINDALYYGFEFIVENHNIFFRKSN